MARIIEGDEDWHTFVLRAWADGDAAMMAIALEEPGAKRDATFSTCGGWGVIASGKVYFDGCTQAGWSGILINKLIDMKEGDTLLDAAVRNQMDDDFRAALKDLGMTAPNTDAETAKADLKMLKRRKRELEELIAESELGMELAEVEAAIDDLEG